jgi:hypothetical protein
MDCGVGKTEVNLQWTISTLNNKYSLKVDKVDKCISDTPLCYSSQPTINGTYGCTQCQKQTLPITKEHPSSIALSISSTGFIEMGIT